jgi:DNA-binding NtrC family response regulator
MNFLVVEDEIFFAQKLVKTLNEYGHTCHVSNKADALFSIDKQAFDFCFIDLNLSQNVNEFEGFELLEAAARKQMKAVVLTAHTDNQIKLECYKRGCLGFIIKPKFLLDPHDHLKSFLKNHDTKKILDFFSHEYITKNINLVESITQMMKVVSTSHLSILITGETGTGKSSIAKLVHQLSWGATRPFIQVNIGQIPENLIESELFGTTKGAFTGAIDRPGLLEMADGGTLFLDEIDSLPKSAQVKIQVALEEGSFFPVGGQKSKKINFRLISATCSNIFELIKKKNMREDFLFRINGYQIHIPPLRERKEDIQPIIDHLTKKLPIEMVFTADAVEEMVNCPWPGNIRQLRDFIYSLQSQNEYYLDQEKIKRALNPICKSYENAEGKNHGLTLKQKKYVYQFGLQFFLDNIEKEMLSDVINKGKSLHQAAIELKIGNRRASRIHLSQKSNEIPREQV